MLWFLLAFAIDLIPTTIPQGQVARLKAPPSAVSARVGDRTIPLFPDANDGRTTLLPVSALETPGERTLEVLDSTGKVLETRKFTIVDAHFKTQNVTLGKELQELKPAPGEMETVAALRKTVSPDRHWTEPFEGPVPGCMTSPYGVQRLHNGKPTGNYHSGIDNRGAEGTPIRAITDGVVRIVRKFNIHGDLVGIDHGQGVTSFYLHMSRFATSEGAAVKKGDVIGYIGSTGRSTAPHLHWSLDVHGIPVNPAQWLSLTPCSNAPTPAAKRRRRR